MKDRPAVYSVPRHQLKSQGGRQGKGELLLSLFSDVNKISELAPRRRPEFGASRNPARGLPNPA